jgi:hypothetical protein
MYEIALVLGILASGAEEDARKERERYSKLSHDEKLLYLREKEIKLLERKINSEERARSEEICRRQNEEFSRNLGELIYLQNKYKDDL